MGKLAGCFVVAALIAAGTTCAASTRWQSWRAAPARVDPARLPRDITILRDVRYGEDANETFDVYAPRDANAAPVIFMVHGGGWRRGDKTGRRVVQNKVLHWLPRGFILVSVDYPMLPDTLPLQQARAVALALAVAQRDATRWGGDPKRFVLMGHSAGAHLVSLISAEPALAISQGALPWLGTVALDSAAFNVAAIMQARHPGLYDRAFGNDPATWAALSPLVQLRAKIAPLLAVCSSLRRDSCPQADAFAAKARAFGARVQTLPEALRHGAINEDLGLPSAYTSAVDGFLASLDPALADRLR
jgi:acetyl esterase/lipase